MSENLKAVILILPIDDEYRIKGDKHSWVIQKGRMREGEITWESVSWFTSLESTVNHLGQLMVRTSDAKTLAEALVEIEKIATLFTQALTTKFEVIRKVKIDDKK